jgi:hypothetical protein
LSINYSVSQIHLNRQTKRSSSRGNASEKWQLFFLGKKKKLPNKLLIELFQQAEKKAFLNKLEEKTYNKRFLDEVS